VRRGLAETADLWPDVRRVYAWVHQAAHILANAAGAPGAVVRRHLRALVAAMARWESTAGTLATAVAHFRRVTRSYWPSLFHCYDVLGLPRTNNDLEHLFGVARYRERRASGRKGASPALVLRGSVRIIAAAATPVGGLTGAQLAPSDLTHWRALRARLEQRHERRRAQLRFRRNPDTYLAALEVQLLQSALPA